MMTVPWDALINYDVSVLWKPRATFYIKKDVEHPVMRFSSSPSSFYYVDGKYIY